MGFMELQVTPKGALYSGDCTKCGMTNYVHEWATFDINEERDALENGTLPCEFCPGRTDAGTFAELGQQYAARYSAPGYMDCTPWSYGKNKKELLREVRSLYGEKV